MRTFFQMLILFFMLIAGFGAGEVEYFKDWDETHTKEDSENVVTFMIVVCITGQVILFLTDKKEEPYYRYSIRNDEKDNNYIEMKD